jgi:hypothetical protein
MSPTKPIIPCPPHREGIDHIHERVQGFQLPVFPHVNYLDFGGRGIIRTSMALSFID